MFVNASETPFAIKRIYVSMCLKKKGLMSFFKILKNVYLSNTDYPSVFSEKL